ncbi:MAG: hypothetical protein GQ535_04040 [Rhodobacteraceae bacterium]|nr:hypothetical protein [Paracoccaceae bacterium]
MTYKTISLKDLTVNPRNDRHGQLDSEQEAVQWLFDNKKDEMKGLARDIAQEARIFDAPLVAKIDNKYIVFDGNRRTTCLKILTGYLQPPKAFEAFFNDLVNNASTGLPIELECQLENSQEIIDKILTRRHSGKLSGEGQLKWDTRAKSNHAERSGRTTAYPLARKIEAYLTSKGYPNSHRIKLSSLDKILDTRIRKNRVGIDLDDSMNLTFTKDEAQVHATLIKISEDIVSGVLTLKQLLLTEDKNAYLDQLDLEGFETALQSPNPANSPKPGAGPKNKNTNQKQRLRKRTTLIPKETDYGIEWRAGQQKLLTLWQQLQFQLKFDKNDIAIAIVFRVLLEQITHSAFERNNLTKPNNDTLQNRIIAVSLSLEKAGEYDIKHHNDIKRRVEDPKSLSSIPALQRVLHAKQEIPAKSDMIALWDSLELYTLGALKK